MKKRVGIEALAIAVPRRYVDIEDLARARGVDPAKFTAGLGAREMAVADPGEDTVALAASAAARLHRSSTLDPRSSACWSSAPRRASITRSPSRRTSTACSKLPRAMRVLDTQHACYGGTAGLMAAVEWIASGAGGGPHARWWCARTSRATALSTAGRADAGRRRGGAARVGEAGAAGARRRDLNGACSADVYDFWRPLGRREARGRRALLRAVLPRRAGGRVSRLAERALARELVRGRRCQRAARAHLLPRAVLQDGAQGARAGAAVRSGGRAAPVGRRRARRGAKSRQLRRAGGAVAGAECARRQRLHGVAVPGARGAAHARGRGARGPARSACSPTAAAARASSSPASCRRGPRSGSRAPIRTRCSAKRERVSVEEYERLMGLTAPLGLAPAPGGFRFTGVDEHRRQYARG